MNAWERFDYELSYIDPAEMGRIWVRTDKAHLVEQLDKIFAKHGYQIRIRKNVLTEQFKCDNI